MRSSKDLLVLGALLGATAWAATRAAKLELDVENRSMRSGSSEEARAEDLRERHFGHDATVVMLIQDLGADSGIEDWVDGVRTRPEVEQFLPLPDTEESDEEALLALTLKPAPDGSYARPLADLTEFARSSAPEGTQVSISGSPVAEAAIAAALDDEQRRIVPLVGAALLLLLVCVYRNLAVALGILLPAFGGIAWTGALQLALDIPINPITALLPPLLLAVGVAVSVHQIDAFLTERSHGNDPDEASRRAWREVVVPATICALTAVVGFLALTTNPIPAVKRFGLLAAAGTIATGLLSFLLLPGWLRLFARSDGLIRRAAGHGLWRTASAGLTRAFARHARRVIWIVSFAAVILGWAWTRLDVDTDQLGILPPRHPFRVETERIGARLGGTETFDLVLEPPEPAGGMLALLTLQQRLLALEGVAGPGGPPRRAADGTGLLTTLLEPSGTSARERIFEQAEAAAQELGWRTVHATGTSVRVARDSGALARGDAYGILATFFALGPCIWLGLRSGRLTLCVLLANAVPCLLLHGGLALAGRPLSVASTMISSVVLGLVVDDAIHLSHGYKEARRSAAPRLAIARTLQASGRAISVTSGVLTLSFLVSLSGELATTREFGVLAAGTILAAWAANLFLLPTLFLFRRRRAGAPIP